MGWSSAGSSRKTDMDMIHYCTIFVYQQYMPTLHNCAGILAFKYYFSWPLILHCMGTAENRQGWQSIEIDNVLIFFFKKKKVL